MPRFQLLVREVGKEPRIVPLAEAIVVGRSRSVELTVDDEEVGRKQFRIGVISSFVVLEGLGSTNPTRVDESLVKVGEKTTLPHGSVIRVGRTEFVVEDLDAKAAEAAAAAGPSAGGSASEGSAAGEPPPVVDQTMVAPRPGLPEAAPPPAADGDAPMQTMEFKRPGSPPGYRPGAPANPGRETAYGAGPAGTPPSGSPANPPPGQIPGQIPSQIPSQIPNPTGDATTAGARPSAGPAKPAEPAPQNPGEQNPGEDELANGGMTMAKGFRPGAFAPKPAVQPSDVQPQPSAPEPAASPAETMPPQPGGPAGLPSGLPAGAAAKPSAEPPVATPPSSSPAVPPPAAPAAAPNPGPPPSASGGGASRPKTVAVTPEQLAAAGIAPASGGGEPNAAGTVEAQLHKSQPRLFVKSEGLKRSIRLMKACNSVGRAATADVQLAHESVSEAHAELNFDGSSWSLRDCGSTNGCLVDGAAVRSASTPLTRNTLLAMGSLQMIFLCVDGPKGGRYRREEERALRSLLSAGQLDRDAAHEIRRMSRGDDGQSIAEIVLRDTQVRPADWSQAIANARRGATLLDRLLSLLTLGRR
ncbi:MAG: FHA domain-containing protein [Planctomycetota bacterium]